MLTADEGMRKVRDLYRKNGPRISVAARYPDLLQTRTAFAMAKCKFEQDKGAWQKANFVSHLSCCIVNVLHFCRDA